eukprot:CAMPEP_0184503910 /NCGR_PEP_ID=MMETSP0113_2-20130426/52172_1 /TAXON_ID=91329 /ORGANISM="Norrisiella sphaerica, Strain BC52" /LENGTH=216 /DNA_ID=CAMNT_0026893495 /DNA_START=173 /DNA_END=823 /DNA_ORIENTATION=+
MRGRVLGNIIKISATTDKDLKTRLIQAAAPTKRGTNASMSQQQAILDQIKELESMNSEGSPTSSPDISGWWSLVYQSTPEPSEKWDPNTEVEGPFLAAFKPLTRDLVRSRGNFQEIDVDTGKVQNLAKFTFLGRPGTLNIQGSCSVASPTRVDVTFEAVDIRIEGLGSWRVPLNWVNPKGWVETTYLDPDFRIGRGDKGSVFIAARTKSNPLQGEP